MVKNFSPKIALVAGEPSGDLLASRIIEGIQQHSAGATFTGIGGPHMRDAGMDIQFPMDTLSVFGYVDALKSLPKLIHTYKSLEKNLLAHRPDVFVGVDAPDFNLRLEHKLRGEGIPTVHFVGPSIWAWRYERIYKIREAVSHMLVLFPFETAIYDKVGIPVTFVGHPTASQIPLVPDREKARQELGLPADARIVAILPGSRASEIKLLAEPFLKAAQFLAAKDTSIHFIVPVVNQARAEQFKEIAQHIPVPNLHIYGNYEYTQASSDNLTGVQEANRNSGKNEGHSTTNGHAHFIEHQLKRTSSRPISWLVMEACDAAIAASGTATLELALFKRPMVIAYKLTPLMKMLMAWKSGQDKPYLPWVGLPNILLNDFVVPELLQEDCTPTKLVEATWNALDNTTYIAKVKRQFHDLHLSLKQDTAGLAAQVILEMCK
ncbi:lipid-A-disaccharide synthase [Pelistega europaea]|uniref:Lipid-A-disaccharide synthase n=1 Tax=Pelistega europaea TaxID=106147 RepID=A0A7Y4L8Q6_9BURK|nr:lipid-A-disaccharide synthase [Pelistega europaea]